MFNNFLTDSNGQIVAQELKDYASNPVDPSLGFRVGLKPIAVISNDQEADTITVLQTNTITDAFIRRADVLYVLNPNTLEIVETFESDEDVEVGDGNIGVVSITTTNPIYIGYIVAIKKLYANNIMIGQGNSYSMEYTVYCRTTNATFKEATLDGATGSGLTNRVPIPDNSSVVATFDVMVKESGTANYYTIQKRSIYTNNGGTTTNTIATTQIAAESSGGLSSCNLAANANDSDDAIKPDCYGIVGKDLNWTINIKAVVSIYV